MHPCYKMSNWCHLILSFSMKLNPSFINTNYCPSSNNLLFVSTTHVMSKSDLLQNEFFFPKVIYNILFFCRRKNTMKHYRRKLDIQWIRIIWRTLIPKQIFYFRSVILTSSFSIVDFLFYFSLYLYIAPDYLFQFFLFIFLIIKLFWMQSHFSQLELPISDYVTDLKSVLDQSIRIIQAMIDVCANSGWLSSSLTCMHLLQMVMQVIIFSAPGPFFFQGCCIIWIQLASSN